MRCCDWCLDVCSSDVCGGGVVCGGGGVWWLWSLGVAVCLGCSMCRSWDLGATVFGNCIKLFSLIHVAYKG